MTSSSSSIWPVSNSSSSAFTPIELDHLSHFLELSQFSASNGAAEGNGAAYLFSDKETSGAATEDMLKKILAIGGAISELDVARGGVDTLPPASLQQFLKASKSKGSALPGVVLTEHKVIYYEI